MKHIPLTQGKFAIVDDEDYEYLMQWKWYALRNGNTYYAVRNFRGSAQSKARQGKILMHRIIAQTSPGAHTDHENHNGLNNRKTNLRQCTFGENQYNRLPTDNCRSQYRGVCWGRIGWVARIKHNSRSIWLGSHTSEVGAAKAYNRKAQELFGEFAYLNPIQ